MAVRFSANNQQYTSALGLASTSQYSFALWVRLAADRNAFSAAVTFSDGETFGSQVFFETQSDGTSMAFIDGGVRGARALTLGTWYYWAVAINGSNGTILSRAASESTFTVSTWTGGLGALALDEMVIGNDSGATEWLNGNVAALKLWTGVTLTQQELEAEAWTYMPRRTTNLRAWHPFHTAETTDYSGLGNTLTGGAGATTEDGPPISWRYGRHRPTIPLGLDTEAAPGAISAPWTVPSPGISTGVTTGPAAIAAPWSVPTPDVSLTGSPPTQVQPLAIAAPWSIPAPAIRVDVTVSPAPIIAAWSVPTPDVSVPVNPGDDLTGPGQISYNGFRLGDGTPYLWRRLSGAFMDMPPIDNGNVPHPSADGAISGKKLPRARVVNYEMRVEVGKDNVDEIALEILAGLPVPDAAEELPLAFRVGDLILTGMAACIDRRIAIDRALNDGIVDGQVVWELSDPRWYSRDQGNATIADGATVEVTNLGNRRTPPTLRLPGPALTPRLEVWRRLSDGTEDLRVLQFGIEIADGDELTIDVRRGTAELNDGTSQVRYMTGSVALPSWVFSRGLSEITYMTNLGTAPAAVALWRHAYA